MFVCLCTLFCLCAYYFLTKRDIDMRFSQKGSTSSVDGFYLFSSNSDRPFGRYRPETGHRSKELLKKRRFSTVFTNIRPLPDEVSLSNFNTICMTLSHVLTVSFMKIQYRQVGQLHKKTRKMTNFDEK